MAFVLNVVARPDSAVKHEFLYLMSIVKSCQVGCQVRKIFVALDEIITVRYEYLYTC